MLLSLDLSLTPVSSATFTESSLQDLLSLSLSLLNTLPDRTGTSSALPSPSNALKISWSSGKGDAETKLWKATHNKEPWIARITNVADISYSELRRGLLVEKSKTEKAAILSKGDEITALGEKVFGDIKVLDVHKLLHVQAFSAREFLETIITRDLQPEEGGKRSCIIVSLPGEGEIKHPAHAHGVYVSVEFVRELGDGKVEVIMACSSDAGGSIPRWVQNMAMAGQILGDGQKFFKFMREHRECRWP